ncbi:hypothetical protein BHM03_00015478 [Ensete ventricosum]|nr:hypothetical protein BHM03_00015478 [Ensete ventricosum]
MTNQHIIFFVNQEKNDNLQKQLDSLSFLSKRKAFKPNFAEKASTASDVLNNFETSDSELQQPSCKMSIYHHDFIFFMPRVRGVLLQDIEDNDDN